MKKSLVALAALAVAGVASAQSSVTLFGVVDAAATYVSNENAAGVKQSNWSLSNSGYNSSRIGFRGTEDLGGGLAASFWLEAGLANDDGFVGGGANSKVANAQFFNRRSTVSLSGRFGEFRLGRDYVPTFWNDTIFDPFGTNGVGTNAVSTAAGASGLGGVFGGNGGNYVRANNTIGYFLPSNLGGFYGQVMYGMSENIETDPAALTPAGLTGGSYVGGRVGYANGPLDVAVAYGENVFARNFQLGGRAQVNTGNFGISWDFGFMKLMGEYSQIDLDSNLLAAPADLSLRGYLIGATIPVGPGLIRVAYSHSDADTQIAALDDPKTDKFAIGYVHNLSKRTALYATAAYLKNKNGASFTNNYLPQQAGYAPGAVGDKSMGYDFGIRHAF